MYQKAGQVMKPGTLAEKLTVEHMAQPRQGMPVPGVANI